MLLAPLTALLLAIFPAECAVSPPDTTLYGGGLETAQAGQVSTFWAQLRNAAGEPETGGGPENQVKAECVTVDGPGFCVETPQSTDLGDGLWRVDYTVGGIYSTWDQPIYKYENGGQPVDDQFYFQGDHSVRVSVGYPFTEIPIEVRPKFYPEYELSPDATNLHLQTRFPFLTGQEVVLADMVEMKDRFGNMVRRTNMTLQLEPRITLLELGAPGQLPREYTPPELYWEWFVGNWYLFLKMRCHSVGKYNFQLHYRFDERTTQAIWIDNDTGSFVPEADIACEPGLIDVDKTVFSSNWTADTGAGDAVAVDIQSLDGSGNAAYLIVVQFHVFRYTLENQDGNLTVGVYLDGELVGTQQAVRSTTVAGLAHTVLQTEEPGTYTLQCEFKHLKYPPYSLYFKPPPPDPGRSFCDGDTTVIVEAGGSGTVAIRLRDRFDEPAAGALERLACEEINMDMQANVEFYAATPAATGAYEMRIGEFGLVGRYTCQVTYDSEAIREGVVSVEVVPGGVDPGMSSVSGTGMGIEVGQEHWMEREEMWMPAGQSLSLFVQAADEFGNQLTEGDPGFRLNEEFEGICSEFDRQGELGLVKFMFSIEESGMYFSRIKDGDGVVVREAWLEVIPAGITHTKCSIEGFADVIAGDESIGVLMIRDKYGNMYDAETPVDITQFQIMVISQEETRGAASATGHIGNFNSADGGYSVTFKVTAAGRYYVRARWEDWPLGVAEQTMEVFPGAVSGEDSIVKPVKQTGIAGEFVSASIEGLDEYANRVTELLFDGTVTASDAESGEDPAFFDYTISPSPSEPWMSTILMNFTRAGKYEVAVTMAGQDLLESPLKGFEIFAGDIDLHESKVMGQGTGEAIMNEWNSIIVIAKDKFDNAPVFSSMDGNLKLAVQGSTAIDLSQFVHESSSKYVAAYMPTGEGSVLVTVLFKHTALPGYPRRLEVANPSKTQGANPVSDMEAYAEWTAAQVGNQLSEDGNRAMPPASQEQEQSDVPSATPEKEKCPMLDCGSNGYKAGCKCICYSGWSSSLQNEGDDSKPCDLSALGPASAPAPFPSQIEEEDEIEFSSGVDFLQYSHYAAGIGVAAVILVLACICCCSSDSSSDVSSSQQDSEVSFTDFPTVHDDLCAKAAPRLTPYRNKNTDSEYIPSGIYPSSLSLRN